MDKSKQYFLEHLEKYKIENTDKTEGDVCDEARVNSNTVYEMKKTEKPISLDKFIPILSVLKPDLKLKDLLILYPKGDPRRKALDNMIKEEPSERFENFQITPEVISEIITEDKYATELYLKSCIGSLSPEQVDKLAFETKQRIPKFVQYNILKEEKDGYYKFLLDKKMVATSRPQIRKMAINITELTDNESWGKREQTVSFRVQCLSEKSAEILFKKIDSVIKDFRKESAILIDQDENEEEKVVTAMELSYKIFKK